LFVSFESTINSKWEWMRSHEDAVVRCTVEFAAKYPSLRRLYPYASLQNLWFSRKSEHPYDIDLPHIRYECMKFHAVGCGMEILLSGELKDVVECVASAVEKLCENGSEEPRRFG
jgi:Family of unknown function (DUF6193)